MNNRIIYTAYVPHGINEKLYRPLKEGDKDYDDYIKFKEDFKSKNNLDFIVFWNNRNIRRKQPGDVILSFRHFVDNLSEDKAKKVGLLMHTQVVDENGTNLKAVKEAICPNCNIIFSDSKISPKELNFMYNLCDVTLNIASNEGFGLSGAESIMAGTPIINNVTGGLQDQCRFSDGEGNWVNFDSTITSNHTGHYVTHGSWSKPVFPSNRSLQGSVPTPYIFDDRCKFEDVSEAIQYWYYTKPEYREKVGLEGRDWALSQESGMSSTEMCNRFVKHINFLLDNWTPTENFTVTKVAKFESSFSENIGITW